MGAKESKPLREVVVRRALEFEPGETYQTKMQTGWTFRVERVEKNKVWGYYNGEGVLCPLDKERLHPRHSEEAVDRYFVCPHCGEKIKHKP
jgi:hypothetical protein